MRMWSIITVVAAFTSLWGCSGAEHHEALKVTTHKGMTFVIVDPTIDYRRVCVAYTKIPPDKETKGLRLGDGKVVSWPSLNRVEFGRPQWHDHVSFCYKLPSDFKATLIMADGSRRAVELENPTDSGLSGQSERGMVLVPFANIAGLVWLGERSYPWIRSSADLEDTIAVRHLPQFDILFTDGHHIRLNDGGTSIEYTLPRFSNRTDPSGNLLLVPNMAYDSDVPVSSSGAEFSVRWKELKEIDIKGRHAHVVLKTGPVFEGDLPPDAGIWIPGKKVPLSTVARITSVPYKHP